MILVAFVLVFLLASGCDGNDITGGVSSMHVAASTNSETILTNSLRTRGVFSGASLDDLMAPPATDSNVVFEAIGVDLMSVVGDMKTGRYEDQAVAVGGKKFTLSVCRNFDPGLYALSVRSCSTNGRRNNLALSVDGRRARVLRRMPLNLLRETRSFFSIGVRGEHTVGLSLLDGECIVLERVKVSRISLRKADSPLRANLAVCHPRLFFAAAEVGQLRVRAASETGKRFYREPPPLVGSGPGFRANGRNGGAYRILGDYALGHVLQPSEEKLKPILDWLETATTYGSVGTDLDAEYFMEGLALTYDWLYDQIPPDLRARVRDRIAAVCRELFEKSLAARVDRGGLDCQNNHFWYYNSALALGAAAVYGEVPEAEDWLALAWDRYERIALSFSSDGSFFDGPGYWDFAMPVFYLYTDLYEWCTGRRVRAVDNGLSGQAAFRMQHMFPGLERAAALEDSLNTLGRFPPWMALWEAKRFHDPVAMGIAEGIRQEPGATRWNLLWLDERISGRDFREALPCVRYYPDAELLLARTGWEEGDTAMAFVSRPMGGRQLAELCARYGMGGTGHNHPEQNHFILFGRGEVLAADTGYTCLKQTREHNTVLVDGKGQYGDGEMWPLPNPGRARIACYVNDGDTTIVTGDATSAYPPALGLQRFERTVVLAGRDLAVVYDRLATVEPRAFTWLLNHYGRIEAGTNTTWTIDRGKARLTVVPVLPPQVTARTSTHRPQYKSPTHDMTPATDADVNLLELIQAPAVETTFLVALLVGDAGVSPLSVLVLPGTGCRAIAVGETAVAFNTGVGEMTVQLPWGERATSKAQIAVIHRGEGECRIVEAPRRQ